MVKRLAAQTALNLSLTETVKTEYCVRPNGLASQKKYYNSHSYILVDSSRPSDTRVAVDSSG
jgi:hypothetical protein